MVRRASPASVDKVVFRRRWDREDRDRPARERGSTSVRIVRPSGQVQPVARTPPGPRVPPGRPRRRWHRRPVKGARRRGPDADRPRHPAARPGARRPGRRHRPRPTRPGCRRARGRLVVELGRGFVGSTIGVRIARTPASAARWRSPLERSPRARSQVRGARRPRGRPLRRRCAPPAVRGIPGRRPRHGDGSMTPWASGSWKASADRAAIAPAAPCGCRGRPRRTGREAADVEAGDGPARTRRSVDLPDPEPPSRSTSSPRTSSASMSESASAPALA